MDRIPNTAGITLAFDRIGDSGSPCVVLLHGLSNSRQSYTNVVAALTGEYPPDQLQIVNIDLRGHGLSTHAPIEQYRASDFAGDVAALLGELGITSARVVGHSLGGVVAMALATRHPHLVSGLFLEDPPLFEGDDARRAASPVASIFPQVVADVLAMQERNAPLAEYEAHLAGQPGAHDVAQRAAALQTWDPLTMRAAVEGIVWQGFDPVAAVTCPITVLQADPAFGAVFSSADADALVGANPHTDVVAMQGVGHSIHAGALDDYLSRLTAFLA